MIYVDADACPVKTEIERVATRRNEKVFMVANGGLRPSQNPLIDMIYVPDGPDEADMWIADRAKVGDVVITSDIPLAAKCVASGARVLRPDGDAFTKANIGNLLATRDLMSDLRASDPFMRGGGKTFGKSDRARFLNAIEHALNTAQKEIET